MKSTVFFSTSAHSYLYDTFHNSFLYAHPLWKFFCEFEEKGIPVAEWRELMSTTQPQLYSKYEHEMQRYQDKYLFLKKNNYFQKLPDERVVPEISELQVERALDDIHQIVFEVTNQCNLNCKYCAYGELYSNYDVRDNAYLSIEKGKKVLDYFISRWKQNPPRSYKREMYVSFYGGEPLLNMDFIKEMVAYVESNFPKEINYQFSMTSNAVLLQKNMDYLVAKEFHLLISLDGDEQGQSYRVNHAGINSFVTILPQIRKLKEAYPEYFKKYVNFNSVIHNRNSAEGVLNFIKGEFDKVPRISELNDNGINADKKEEFLRTFQNISESLQKAKSKEKTEEQYFINLPKVRSMGIFTTCCTDNYYSGYNDFFSQKSFHSAYPTGTCIPFSKKIFITATGKVYPCERIGEDSPLGKVNEDKGLIIDSKEVASFYNTFFLKMSELCNRCYRLTTCASCMYYFKDIQNPACEDFQNRKSYEAHLARHLEILELEPHLQARIREEVTFS